MYEIFKIANLHAFHVWEKPILSCNDTTYFLHFFFFVPFTTQFSPLRLRHQTPQPRSAIYGAPPFTGNRFGSELQVITEGQGVQ